MEKIEEYLKKLDIFLNDKTRKNIEGLKFLNFSFLSLTNTFQ